MDLNKLYYFYITAKHQHVTRAAAELQIAQPALTKSIKFPEQDLGVPLFYKQGRSIRLTDFGKHLLTRLESVFPVVDRLPEELSQMKKRAVDSITIHAQAASLLVTEARPLRRICDDLCLQGGFRPNILFESDSPEAVRNLISAGAGIGFWPAFCFGKISKDVALLSIMDIPAQHTLQLCLHDNGLPRKTAEDFFDFLIAYMEQKKAAARTP